MQTTVGTVKRSRSGFSAVHVQQSIGPIERNRCKIRWRHSYRWRHFGLSVATRPCRFLSKRRHTIAAGLRETRACEKSMVWRNRYVCTFYFPIWFFFCSVSQWSSDKSMCLIFHRHIVRPNKERTLSELWNRQNRMFFYFSLTFFFLSFDALGMQ